MGLLPNTLSTAVFHFWLNFSKIFLPYPPAGGMAKASKII
jgi:hypothetical protein